MYLAVFALTLVCTRAVAATAMSGSVEMQTSYLNSIYEAVKNRQLRDGELNLLRNESMGFANAVRSFAEKGNPQVAQGNRVATFDLSMLMESKKSQTIIQLVLKYPTREYFQSVKHLHLYKHCPDCTNLSEMLKLASYDVTEADGEREWLELTIDCPHCNWTRLAHLPLMLQLTDESDVALAFDEISAQELKSFLVVYTYDSAYFLSEKAIKALQKRQIHGNSTIDLANRTTIHDLQQRNISCSRQEVFLTTDELRFEGSIIAPVETGIHLSYCYGHCNSALEVPYANGTTYDSRTRILIQRLNELRRATRPPPCCIAGDLAPMELIVVKDEDVIELETIPTVVECKCQL